MKYMLLVLVVFLLPFVQAQEVLWVDLTIDKNDAVVLDSLQVYPGRPTSIMPEGDYSLRLYTADNEQLYSHSIRVLFYVMSNPPAPVEEQLVSVLLPTFPDMHTFRVYKGEEEIYSVELDLCNGDGVCGSFESAISCPGDCDPAIADDFCIKEENGICDPDCNEGVDPDCAEDEPTGTPDIAVEKVESTFVTLNIVFISVAIIIIIVAMLLLIRKARNTS
jgi:hypothetical protein